MTERFANNASTTLSAAVETTDGTSISVTSAAAPFPQTAQFRIIIDSEIFIVTDGAGTTTWTVTRGAESTTAATHLNGAAVTHVLTAGALGNLPITTAAAVLGADVALTPANTWVDVLSLSLAAGTWIIWGSMQIAAGDLQTDEIRLYDGANVLASGGQTITSGAYRAQASIVSGAVVLGATTTITLQGYTQTSTTASTAKKLTFSTIDYATRMTAIKVA
jgi:hypothetical protein